MNSFLTVEDINSVKCNKGIINGLFSIDTSVIDTDAFLNVRYDYCRVSHTINGDDHTFKFEIYNTNWRGEYYLLDSSGDYIDDDATYNSSDNYLEYTCEDTSITLVLYCSSLSDEFDVVRLTGALEEFEFAESNIVELHSASARIFLKPFDETDYSNEQVNIEWKNLFTNNDETDDLDISTFEDNGVDRFYFVLKELGFIFRIEILGMFFYIYLPRTKETVDINITDDLTVGKLNKVYLTIPNKYSELKNYNPTLTGKITYGNNIVPLETELKGEGWNFYFNMDLINKTDLAPIKVKLHINESDYINSSDYEFVLFCKYIEIDNMSDLLTEINNGSTIIRLGGDISIDSRIDINNDLIIYGQDNVLDLNEYGFNVKSGCKLNINDLELINGDTSILQNKNSEVLLNKCTFNGCKSSIYNNLGSVVFCDIDIESLSDNTDFKTELNDCFLVNNHSCLFTGGNVIIDNCRFLNNDLDYVDKNNPAFLYQNDGDAVITNSIFDIDYIDPNLCNNHKSISFAQALLICGENATINNATHSLLQDNNALPFFDGYNNNSHVFVKYYYSQIDKCVFTSPTLGNENKAVCYGVSGVDWVYKQNVQITRADWNTQNEIRKIRWED